MGGAAMPAMGATGAERLRDIGLGRAWPWVLPPTIGAARLTLMAHGRLTRVPVSLTHAGKARPQGKRFARRAAGVMARKCGNHVSLICADSVPWHSPDAEAATV